MQQRSNFWSKNTTRLSVKWTCMYCQPEFCTPVPTPCIIAMTTRVVRTTHHARKEKSLRLVPVQPLCTSYLPFPRSKQVNSNVILKLKIKFLGAAHESMSCRFLFLTIELSQMFFH